MVLLVAVEGWGRGGGWSGRGVAGGVVGGRGVAGRVYWCKYMY